MTKVRFNRYLSLVLPLFFINSAFFSFQSFSAHEEDKNVLYISVDSPWLPYLDVSDSGEIGGTDVTLLSDVLAEMGYQLKSMNIADYYQGIDAEHGRIDVSLGVFKTPKRMVNNWFSVPYRYEKVGIAFLANRSNKLTCRSSQLGKMISAGSVIVMNKSAWYGKVFEEKFMQQYRHQVFHIDGATKRLKMLKMNRADIVIGDVEVIKESANSIELEDIVICNELIFKDEVHFMFSKYAVDEEFMRKFNKSLKLKIKYRIYD